MKTDKEVMRLIRRERRAKEKLVEPEDTITKKKNKQAKVRYAQEQKELDDSLEVQSLLDSLGIIIR